MMRFKQFITESGYINYDDITTVFKKINDECQPFLVASGDQPLFRGMGITVPANYAPHPANRKPRDSDPEFNFMFNAMIDLAFDIEQVRKISIFGTGNYRQAKDYGDLFFMFPVGNIEYIWSDKIRDSYESAKTFFKKIADAFGGEMVAGYISRIFESLCKNTHFSGPDGSTNWVKNKSLAAHITFEEMKNELEYRGLDDEDIERLHLSEQNVYKTITTALAETGKEYYQQDFLDQAISNYKEIFFYKTGGYYSISIKAVYEMAQAEDAHILNNSYDELYDFLLKKIYSSK